MCSLLCLEVGREYTSLHVLWELGPSSLAVSPAHRSVDVVRNKVSNYFHIERWGSVTSPLESGYTVTATTDRVQWKQCSVASEAEPKRLASTCGVCWNSGTWSPKGPHKCRNFCHDVRRPIVKPRPPADALADGPTFK